MTKKIIFCISITGLLLFLIVGFIADKEYCGSYDQLCNSTGLALIVFLPTFIFSATVYFMRDIIFRVWRNFTFFWLPITIIVVFMTPETTGNMLFNFDKQFVSIVLSGLYAILSVFLIVTMSIIAHYKPQKRS